MKATVGKTAVVAMAFMLTAAGLTVRPAAAQRNATRPQVIMPDGPVRQIIRKNCTKCHGIDDYAFHSLDRAGWEQLIKAKHKGQDVSIPEQDYSRLLDWIVSKFGPTTKPFPRAYIPPEITTFFTDPEAKRLLDRACTKCHAAERINPVRKTGEGWRVLLVDMRERGATLDDEEIERLAEWLGRVQGTNQSDRE